MAALWRSYSSSDSRGTPKNSSASIMERRRHAERSNTDPNDFSSSPRRNSKTSLNTFSFEGSVQLDQQACNTSVLRELEVVNKELEVVNQKLDDMFSHIGRCLDDTAHLRKLAQRWPCETRPPNSHPARQKQASHCVGPSMLRAEPLQPIADDSPVLFDAESSGQKLVLNHSSTPNSDLEGSSASKRSSASPLGAAARKFVNRGISHSLSGLRSESADGECVSQGSDLSQKNKDGQRQHSIGSSNSDFLHELYLALSRVRPRSQVAKTTWSFLEDPDTVPGGRTVMSMISLAILISAFIPVLQTIQPPPFDRGSTFVVEVVLDVVFAIEVVIRFLSCPNRISFCLNTYNLIDIAAGLLGLVLRSLYTSSLVEADSEGQSIIATLICTVPVLRLLKLFRRFEKFHLILRAFRMAMEALPVLLYILIVIVMVFASLIYVVEPRDNIESLPQALWLTIVTVGTVGYGDLVPESSFGSLAVTVLIIASALYMAIPLGIVGSAFSTVWADRDRLLLVHRTRSRILDRGFKAQDIPTVFCSFDTDGDGQLELPEFLSMMDKLQIGLGGDRLVQLFSSCDVDGSGAIDDKEFVRTLFPQAFAEIYSQMAVTAEDNQEVTDVANQHNDP